MEDAPCFRKTKIVYLYLNIQNQNKRNIIVFLAKIWPSQYLNSRDLTFNNPDERQENPVCISTIWILNKVLQIVPNSQTKL